MTEYSRMAKGHFTVTGNPSNAKIINLPFKPDAVEFWNYTVATGVATDQKIASGYWDADMGQGFAVIQGYLSTALVYDTVTTGGISTFSAGQMLQFGPTLTVTSIDKTTNIVTTSADHNLATGDVVIFEGLWQDADTGMPQINGLPFTVTVTAATTFTIEWNLNQSEYTSISAGGTGFARVKKVLYPYLYFPGQSFISAITLGTTTIVDTTDAHNFQVGQEVAFRIPSYWGTVELNSLPNLLTPGAPMYGYVIAVTDYNTVVVNIDSTTYTPFTSNQLFTDVSGMSYAQIVAVGDINTGGILISAGSPLYPPPYSRPIGSTAGVDTINGPAIRGAFVNNTSQGFIIGSGKSTKLTTTARMVGTAGDVVYWRAFLHDMDVT